MDPAALGAGCGARVALGGIGASLMRRPSPGASGNARILKFRQWQSSLYQWQPVTLPVSDQEGRLTVASPTRAPLPDKTDDAFQQELLKSVNDYRAKHGVPALTIDPKLVTSAKDRAQVVSSYNQLDEDHQGAIKGQGENLYWGASSGDQLGSAADATKDWYSEISNYNFTTAAANPGTVTGHFTQLVWKATTTIGAARAYGKGSQYYETYIVAEFSAQGNMTGQYADNVPAPTSG
jgi:glioma pathogenesis-related protein 2